MLTAGDTKKLITEFSKVFATKKDLSTFTTKSDLKPFVTKDDLRQFATKKDLDSFATKDDLKPFATKDDLATQLFATREELNAKMDLLKQEMKTFRNETFDRLDAVYKEVVKFREDEDIHSYKHEEVEKRLKQIESVPVIAHAIKK